METARKLDQPPEVTRTEINPEPFGLENILRIRYNSLVRNGESDQARKVTSAMKAFMAAASDLRTVAPDFTDEQRREAIQAAQAALSDLGAAPSAAGVRASSPLWVPVSALSPEDAEKRRVAETARKQKQRANLTPDQVAERRARETEAQRKRRAQQRALSI